MTPQAINYLKEQNLSDMRYYLNSIDEFKKNADIPADARDKIVTSLENHFKMLNEINLHLKELEDGFHKKG